MKLKTYKWHESLFIKLKINAARITANLLPKNKQPIVLTGGNLGEKYEDNISVFHTYLVKNRPDLKTYWMYDQKTDYVQKENIPNAVPLGSFKNYLLFFRADYSFHGHSIIYDLAPDIENYIHLNKKTVMTHISHGIEGFKKILIQEEDKPLLRRTDYFNCASNYERNIKLNGWKFPEDKLITTGMARFDRLRADNPAKQVKNIMLMMTWREWLFDLTEEEFKNSDYFKSMQTLLNAPELNRLIEAKGLNIKVVLHPFMKNYEEYFKTLEGGDSISFVTFDDVSIKEEVIEADMLLTDYTSVSWDFLYQNKPIIFYMFDQETLEQERGTYLDLDKDLYGYKAENTEEVIDLLEHIVTENPANPFYENAGAYFDYFDSENCKRLADKVIGPKDKTI